MNRASRSFWTLVVIATVAVGTFSRALAWPAGPRAGLAVAASGVIAIIAAGLALRILVRLSGVNGRTTDRPAK